MRKLLTLITLTLCLSTLVGCANLDNKHVMLAGVVDGFKFTTTINPQTGSFAPEMGIGWGCFVFLDSPADSGKDIDIAYENRSLWNSSNISCKLNIKVTGGNDNCGVNVKVNPNNPLFNLGDVKTVVTLEKQADGKIIKTTVTADGKVETTTTPVPGK